VTSVVLPLLAASVVAATITGLLPVLAIKLVLRLYPQGDPRRKELLAELLAVPFIERLPWVFQSLGLALTEGLPARWRGWRTDAAAPNHRRSADIMIRAFDVTVATTMLIVVAPLLAAAAVLVKSDDGGPVFIRQRRVGRKDNDFQLVRFRTMAADHIRITKAGRFLRATSLNELPQLFNVLRGDMSLVGPRPATRREVDEFPTELRERHQVRPGMTGLWQVRSDAEDDSFEEYQRCDLEWVRTRSVRRYLKILLLTLPPLGRLVRVNTRQRFRGWASRRAKEATSDDSSADDQI